MFKLVVHIINPNSLQHVFTISLILWTQLLNINVRLVICNGFGSLCFLGMGGWSEFDKDSFCSTTVALRKPENLPEFLF